MELPGSRVLITGSSRGIGAALARELAHRGARVALVARSGPEIEALAAELGGEAYVADLSQAEDRRSMWERVITDGPVDVLVNNAGLDLPGSLVDADPNEIEQQLQLNLHAPIDLCRLAIPTMLAAGSGHIVNISSLASVVALPGYSVYGATKAGLSHFTSGLRNDLRGRPIRTTLVEIGVTATDMADNMRGYPPSARALRRLELLQLTVDTPLDTVVQATADAISRDRRHVRLPRRGAVFAAMVEFPRRLAELALTGVKV